MKPTADAQRPSTDAGPLKTITRKISACARKLIGEDDVPATDLED